MPFDASLTTRGRPCEFAVAGPSAAVPVTDPIAADAGCNRPVANLNRAGEPDAIVVTRTTGTFFGDSDTLKMMRPQTRDRRRALFEEAKRIIDREYPQELDLDSLARRLATSRRQLQRSFAEMGDTSFRTYLAQVRMAKAVELLHEGRLPVRDVAVSVGYRQPAQFAKTFRRHHGKPPSSFRPRRGGSTAQPDALPA